MESGDGERGLRGVFACGDWGVDSGWRVGERGFRIGILSGHFRRGQVSEVTLCVGIERRGRIWIAADSSSVCPDGWSERAREPKIWRSAPWLVASAGDWRALSIVRLSARFPAPTGEASVALGVVSEIRRALESSGWEEPKTDDEPGPWWLIGASGVGLWQINQYHHAARMTEAAIGFPDYARGWLDGSQIEEPELRLRECIKAASRRMPGAVRLPVTVLEA